jgi:hypothetical protein
VSFSNTKGSASIPEPWYSQVLVAPLLGLAFLGCARAGRMGRITAAGLVGLFAYMLSATYLVKLIPLYANFTGRTSLIALIALYTMRLPFLEDHLNQVALAPAGVLLGLAIIVSVMAVAQAVALIRSLFPRDGSR